MKLTHKFTEKQAQQFIQEEHDNYYQVVSTFLKNNAAHYADKGLPTFNCVDSVFRQCGQYTHGKHNIQYSIPYCVYSGAEYRETVAHEMVHALLPDATISHGKMFLLVCREACKIQGTDNDIIYHQFSISEVLKVAEELKQIRGSVGNDISFVSRRFDLSGKMNKLADKQKRKE